MYLRNAVGGHVVLGLVGLFAFVSGCSQKIEPQEPPLGYARIQKAASACRQFAASHKRQPSSVDELKAWAKKLPKTQLDYMGIENLDEAFISPRDQQPYVIRGGSQKPGPMMIQMYEKTGEGGKRYVATNTGSILELEEQAFNQFMSNTR